MYNLSFNAKQLQLICDTLNEIPAKQSRSILNSIEDQITNCEEKAENASGVDSPG